MFLKNDVDASRVADVLTVELACVHRKEYTSSPIVSTEALFLSCTIDATEGRDVATVDIPGVLIQTDTEGEVDTKLEGTMDELFTNSIQSHTANTCAQKKVNRYCICA